MSSESFEAPLAGSEDWADFGDFEDTAPPSITNGNVPEASRISNRKASDDVLNCNGPDAGRNLSNANRYLISGSTTNTPSKLTQVVRNDNDFDDCNFIDSISGSLEDLVHSFDEKIINCFQDYDEHVETFAPIQVRTHEELLSENE